MNNNVDRQYFELIRYILNNGTKKIDRTGTGTISVFDYTMRFNMSEGFPLLTSKKMFIKGIIHELIWFLRGDTNIKYLVDNDVHIWDGDAYKNYLNRYRNVNNHPLSKEEFINKIKTDDEFAKKWGELGPIYGAQWRNWGRNYISDSSISLSHSKLSGGKYIDQIANLINELKNNPDSRRLMVSAWNVGELDQMALPPCHYGFQCYTQEMNMFERKKYWCDSIGKSINYAEDFTDIELDNMGIPKRRISLKWTQRSCDVPLGIPFNIASYGFLLHLLAREVNMIPHELIFSGGDCHIYLNQIDAIKDQLNNKTFTLPKLVLNNKSIDDLRYEDFQIIGYQSSDSVKIPLSN
jgi:thymidylate synthase